MVVIEQKYIKDLICQGIASVTSPLICREFDEYVSQEYSWQELTGYRIDWSKHTNFERFHWIEKSDEETAIFMSCSCLSKYSKVVVIYARNEPGIVVSFDYAKDNVDVLSCFNPGTLFLVAVSDDTFDSGDIKIVKSCFIEIDSMDWLTSTVEEK